MQSKGCCCTEIEIERRYLVIPDRMPAQYASSPRQIEQAYLSNGKEPETRIRAAMGKPGGLWEGTITVKIRIIEEDQGGTGSARKCLEYNTPVRAEYAHEIIKQCHRRVDKARCDVPQPLTVPQHLRSVHGDMYRAALEVDIYRGRNAGLIVAEIELPSADFTVLRQDLPLWVGPEITGVPGYSNYELSMCPFDSWSQEQRAEHNARLHGIA